MPLHLRKLCVGAESIADLEGWQRRRVRQAPDVPLRHVTRSWPRRADEILEGGSLYWIIKGVMSVRQPILGFDPVVPDDVADDPDVKPYCGIRLAPTLVRTEPWPHRPFQGWRYLKPEEAPPDLDGGESAALPAELVGALRQLGAW